MKVAAVQACPLSRNFGDLIAGKDIAHAAELVIQAADQGAELVCLPEMYPGCHAPELHELARERGICLVYGAVLPAGAGAYRNVAQVVDADGTVVGSQAKNNPTETEFTNRIIPGDGAFRVIECGAGRLGIAICADFAFFGSCVPDLMAQRADILVNPGWWFALGEGFANIAIARHLEYGLPVIAPDIVLEDWERDESAPIGRVGGFSVIAVPPVAASLPELAKWFRTKPGGSNTLEGAVMRLGEEEAILIAELELASCRNFQGYFYRTRRGNG